MKHFERILKTTGVIQASPSEQLSTVLARLGSSHDAAFVFNEKKVCLGIINPYYTLIRQSNPGTTKVENCLFHPPHINAKDTLEHIVKMMIDSKVHYLPVYDDKKTFIGITSARRVLTLVKDMKVASTKLKKIVDGKDGRVVTVYGDDTIGTALTLFKDYKVSKLVMIDKNMKLTGVLSYYDLIPYLVAPGTSKLRGRGASKTSQDKEKLMNMKVKNYAKTTTLTLTPEHTVADAIELILTRKLGSVVVIDGESHPVGILTTRDLFASILFTTKRKPVEYVKKRLNAHNDSVVDEFVGYVFEHIQSRKEIQRAKVMAEEEKNGKLYKLALYIHPSKGEVVAYEREGKDFPTLIQDLKKQIRKEKT